MQHVLLCKHSHGRSLLGYGFLLHIFPFTYILPPLRNSQNTLEYSENLSTMILQMLSNSTYYYRIVYVKTKPQSHPEL